MIVRKIEAGDYKVELGTLRFAVRKMRDTLGRRGGHWTWGICLYGEAEAERKALRTVYPHADLPICLGTRKDCLSAIKIACQRV